MTATPAIGLLPVAGSRATARLAWHLVRGRKLSVIATVGCFAALGLAGIVPVWMIGKVVDAARDGSSSDTIVWFAVVMVLAGLLAALFQALSSIALAQAVAPALAQLREDVLDRSLNLDLARVESAGVGDIVSRVSDDVRQLTTALDEAIPALLQSLVAIVFTAGGLFALDWRLGIAGLGALPFYVWALRWYLPRSGPFYSRERTATGERAQALVTGIEGSKTIRAFGREDNALGHIGEKSHNAMAITVEVFTLYTRFTSRMNGSELLGLLFVLTAGFTLVRTDIVTVGAATAAALFFHRLFNPIGAVLFFFDTVQSSGAALARLAGVVLMPHGRGSTTEPGDHRTLELTGISHTYDGDHEVLHAVDLSVSPGERVAVVGATGAGKTTLGGIAAGTIMPTSGNVTFGKLNVSDANAAFLRRYVVLLSQEVHVFAGTIGDNLLLARADASPEQLHEALDRIGARRWVDALPDGLQTRVGGFGHTLTPAQAQQLALARILLRDPPVVVLDEATAEAGSYGARELERAAQVATEGRAALVIAHRLTQAQSADRVVVMHQGRVVEEGSHADLVVAGGRYAALWSAWSAS